MPEGWDGALYDRFKAERRQPFDDLLARCRPIPGGRAVDLGCGTGELTAELHRALGAARTTGIDSSPAMLERARSLGRPGLDFSLGDLGAWDGPPVDLVVANASLHWVSDHPSLLAQLRGGLAPGGQLAFQVPANFDHPSHTLARRVAAEPPFAQALGASAPADRGDSVLSPTAYAEVLHALGAVEQSVALNVYGHLLDSTDEVVQWVLGTLLTPYRAVLEPGVFAAFVERYREALADEVGARRPYFYAFPRIVCWARFP
ncbi:MAG: methyltransferase domain-containing protein [Acidimicrobiales bacterium]